MADKKFCPHCGQLMPPHLEGEPGIIRDTQAVEARPFNLIKLEDLNGDPYHDYPLIAERFKYSLPDLIEAIQEDKGRFLKGRKSEAEPAQSAERGQPSQLWLDLDAVRPHLSKIIQQGQFAYGHQSRIAEALGVPNQGNYRRRIQNVVSALQRTLIRESNTSNTLAAPRTAISNEKPRSEAA